jgi:hypothetical protein
VILFSSWFSWSVVGPKSLHMLFIYVFLQGWGENPGPHVPDHTVLLSCILSPKSWHFFIYELLGDADGISLLITFWVGS